MRVKKEPVVTAMIPVFGALLIAFAAFPGLAVFSAACVSAAIIVFALIFGEDFDARGNERSE